MTENAIPPQLAADLARDIYDLVKLPSTEAAIASLRKDFGHVLEFAKSKPITGRTGAKSKIWSTKTGMAIVLKRKGPFKGQLFVVFRGTKILADLLADGSVTSTKSANHYLVHAGFFRVFLDFLRISHSTFKTCRY